MSDQNKRTTRRIAVHPKTNAAMYDAYVELVQASGAELVELEEADALLWADPRVTDIFPDAMSRAPGVEWIQLPYAGVEGFVDHLDHDHTWTCAKGVYADPVAEHAIGLALAGMRNLHAYGQAVEWTGPVGTNLIGANVTVLGAGGITESIIELLEPWRCHITVVRRQAEPLAGAEQTLSIDQLTTACAEADLVVVALALTDETVGIIDAAALASMQESAWLVNVGRGRHVVTDDLVDALERGVIAGAALDVTDPEPLPAGHPLWSLPNCLITPHTANTPEMGLVLLRHRVAENLRRYCAGEELLGPIDVDAGY